jgi:solute carrier family 9 (sodium/hydrogen exchanger), member 8
MVIRRIVVPFVLLFAISLNVIAQNVTENSVNVTTPSSNVTLSNATDKSSTTAIFSEVKTTSTVTPSTTTTTTIDPMTIGKNAVEQEKGSSLSIFFVLCVIALGILLIHLMLQTHFQYLPGKLFGFYCFVH